MGLSNNRPSFKFGLLKMLKSLFLFFSIKKRLWRYLLLSFSVTVSILTFNVVSTYAFPWQEILIRGVQVIQLSTISDQQEVEIGKQIRQELINSGRIELYENPLLNSYLNDIGSKLSQVSDRPEIPYSFSIVKSDEVNAFATMGGFVYIHTGLMKLAANEAELASVVAHEIGHITARHSLQQMRQQSITQGLLSAAGLDRKQAVQLGVTLALDLPHSRQDEYEADQLGLAMLTKAGYAPGAMVNFMQKLQRQTGKIPSFLSTHPAADERVEVLAKEIPQDEAFVGNGLDNQAYKQMIRPIL
jgi:predicted Zn-dependent protease